MFEQQFFNFDFDIVAKFKKFYASIAKPEMTIAERHVFYFNKRKTLHESILAYIPFAKFLIERIQLINNRIDSFEDDLLDRVFDR